MWLGYWFLDFFNVCCGVVGDCWFWVCLDLGLWDSVVFGLGFAVAACVAVCGDAGVVVCCVCLGFVGFVLAVLLCSMIVVLLICLV